MKMRDGIRLGPITSSQSLKPLPSGFSSSHSFVQFSQVYSSFPPTARVLSALTAFLLSMSLWPWLMHSLDRSPLTPLTPRIDSTLILSAPPLHLHYPCCCVLIRWCLLGYPYNHGFFPFCYLWFRGNQPARAITLSTSSQSLGQSMH